jgi:hypothetical protein
MNNSFPQAWYENNITQLETQLKEKLKRRRFLGWARFLSLAAVITSIVLLWSSSLGLVVLVTLLLLSIFFALIAADIRNNEKISNIETLIQINHDEIRIQRHDFNDIPAGNYPHSEQHDYAEDLDIFGHASIYQYTNRTTSEQGNLLYSNWLLSPATNQEIIYRQEAARELALKPEWRQQLQALGKKDHICIRHEETITTWNQIENKFISSNIWSILRILLPAIPITSLALHIAGFLPSGPFYLLVIVSFLISLLISRKVMPAYQQLNKIAAELDTLTRSIEHVENEKFQSELLQYGKAELSTHGDKASRVIKRLKRILDRLDYRLNPLIFLPLNTFLFWDLQQVFALEKWRNENKGGIQKWFQAIATLEALASVGNIRFNHPGWVFPELSNERVFEGIDLGHPLIPPGKRVTSTFALKQPAQIGLITGSNMAGKSTFLRTVGINIILAMAGAPVCASYLRLSNMKVVSSMRIKDNLEENTSTFYAELKKLKYIIDAVNAHEPVFLLLDEMLRGTNSADRHTGSTALIRQLLIHDAIGLVATHDLELARLEKEYPARLLNYHFDVQVEQEELYFDYKLKPGVCNSMNASLLMKKIGIEL